MKNPLFPNRPQKNSLLRSWVGPLTSKLVRVPGQFGLGQVPASSKPDSVVPSVCGFCSTGCSLNIHLKENEAVNLSANPNYPVNLGMACPKGWEALTPLSASDRATTPLMKDAQGNLVETDWETAMSAFSKRFSAIRDKHGSGALAWLGTGQIPTEEMAFLGALGKFGIGIQHGDGNTRQCMATAVTAYKQSFGFDAPPYTYADFEESEVIILVGANLCIAHPIMWQRVMQNQASPEIIVIDPRTTETAMAATQHFAIQPKSDLVFFYAIAQQLISDGLVQSDFIEAHTLGFKDFSSFLQDFTPERAAQLSGISEERIIRLARLIGSGKRVSFWWTMGVNQSHEGTRLAQSLINLALMTGNIGKPGTGANSITGQCNAMGSRMFSNTTSLFGGREFTNPDHREEVASILNIPLERIPNINSYPYHKIIEGIESGEIKGLWIIATNPAHSWIHQGKFKEILSKLECLVVQDMYHSTETAQAADILLPAAGWGEKDGTFINSERRIGRIRKVRRAPGQALSDFHIFQLATHAFDCAEMFKEWTDPEAVFRIMQKLSEGKPCDFSGIQGYDHLDEAGGIQWPFSKNDSFHIDLKKDGERRLFEDGTFHHPDKRARFLFAKPSPLPEACCEDYPFTLLTGRGSSSQWHTQTRTGKSDVLRKLAPSSLHVEISLEDAERLLILAGDLLTISSRRANIQAKAHVCSTILPGQAFLPMHDPRTNLLTFPIFDPYSHQPGYKACAVNITHAHR